MTESKINKSTAVLLLYFGIGWPFLYYVLGIAQPGLIFFVLLLPPLLIRREAYAAALGQNLAVVVETLRSCGLVKIAEQPHRRSNWIDDGLPVTIEKAGSIATVMKAFEPSPFRAAYKCWILLDREKLAKHLQLTDEEKHYIDGWGPLQILVSWEQWGNGYQRWLIQPRLWDQKGIPLEYSLWPGDDGCPGTVWRGPLGPKEYPARTDYPQLEIAILPNVIRIGVKHGRFGERYIKDQNIGLEESIAPQLKWMLAEIPITEAGLA
ncbi:MAG: hypothetical protein HY348_06065, partial [Nitrospira defluvii]|nr:hypothetical protein [Nitrospira defluvii]